MDTKCFISGNKARQRLLFNNYRIRTKAQILLDLGSQRVGKSEILRKDGDYILKLKLFRGFTFSFTKES